MQSWRVRQVVNTVNGSTLLGLGIAAVGRARISRGPRGLLLAAEFRIGFPPGGAFTIGDVVITRHGVDYLASRPRLLAHEERHCWQYVACLGLPMLPLYVLAVGYSYLRGGDPATHNVFERAAGLADGGYSPRRVSSRPRRA
jgi:hypothetical protein